MHECDFCSNTIDFHEIVECIASALDAKDPYTAGHSRRVSDMALVLCRLMGLKEEDTEKIHIAGHLHDIGKIGVPDAVLNKEGKLTDGEFAFIRKHPQIGADILNKSHQLRELSEIVLMHHERYDGKGYPDGLKGTEIPEFARIIGVADAYDAMTSKRSYRDVLPQQVVRDELEKGKGTQFDPLFAEIMIQMIDDDIRYTMREKFKGEV